MEATNRSEFSIFSKAGRHFSLWVVATGNELIKKNLELSHYEDLKFEHACILKQVGAAKIFGLTRKSGSVSYAGAFIICEPINRRNPTTRVVRMDMNR